MTREARSENVCEKGQIKVDQDLDNQARYPYLEFQDTPLSPPPYPPLRYQGPRAVLQ